MYVIYPAEELFRIYESPLRQSVRLSEDNTRSENKREREVVKEEKKLEDSSKSEANKRNESLGKRSATRSKTSDTRDKKNRGNKKSGKRKNFWFFRRITRGQKCENSTNKSSTNNNKSVNNNSDNNSYKYRDASKDESGRLNEKTISSSRRTKTRNCTIMQNNRNPADEASTASINSPLRDLTQANLNEPLKQHNGNALKLVQTVSEFAQELSGAMESHGSNVRRLVDEFRSKSGETRGDAGGMRRVWENLLRQVEADAAAHLDLAAVLQQQLSRPTLEASFHRKIQSRKIFAHREAYDQVVGKTEEKLQRARVDYKRAYGALLTNDPTIGDPESLRRAYLEAHNAYVLQLRATNAIVERYQHQCLPALLAEMAEVYKEVCTLTCNCVSGICEATGERSGEQAKRYISVAKEAQAVTAANDLQILARNLASNAPAKKPPRRLFVAPSPPEQISVDRLNQIPSLRDELVTLSGGNQTMLEDLRREAESLNQEIRRLQDSLDALVRMQRKSAEGSLFTKVAELQEDISMKRFDLGVAQLHLAAVQAQKELFGAGEAGQPDPVSNRKMSNGSTGSNTKHKWLKAFKSLKTSSPTTPPPADKGKQAMYHAVSTVVAMSRKSLESEGGHQWREYTYRKITPCDACGQVLRGHSRQGFRCRGCKANAHADCINTVQPTMCPSLAPKKGGGIPLLRRQKTTAVTADDAPTGEHNVDATYQVLKQAGEIRGNSTNSPPTPPVVADQATTIGQQSTTRTSSHPCSSSTSAPHSPQRRRERLNLRMKSLSLDSPEGSAHVRHRPRDYYGPGQKDSTPPRHSDSGSINRLSPCSPGQGHPVHKHVRSAIRMSSMELPDDNEKSYSSASTSPCPSPHTNNQNHLNPSGGKRLLPANNLYVVLYNFDARHRDELDLKAGYKVTVIEKSEKDWWKGKCLGGRAGYFPSAYVMRVEAGQKTLQVTRNLQLADQTTLLRDQIVIQVGEEVDGVAMVRCAADTRSSEHVGKEGDVRFKETLCPLKYLQEV
ncbi:uncharacterized protein Stacl isoform X2 [Venturia canescens]|uniref:uncharacterized protein Stacl isoform X2 n=1 Tax=Venturia canescens TaxID=32260 RepID=UPI001C9C5E99|nr:uncharacterized protein LOC122406401 isoform X2 [Venturia canescens]